ncbi:glycosyltransferase [Candidatus Harpocratesius sp.]
MKEISMISLSNYPDVRILRESISISKELNSHINIFCYKQKCKPEYEKFDSSLTIHRIFINFSNYNFPKSLKYILNYLFGFIGVFFLMFKKTKILLKSSIIHIHNPPDFLTFPFLLFKVLFRKKIILDRHEPLALSISSIFDKNEKSIFFKFLSVLELVNMKYIDGIIVINELEKKYIENNLPKKEIAVVGNSIDNNSQLNGKKRQFFKDFELSQLKLQLGFKKTDIIILYEGLIAKRRDLDIFIDLFKDNHLSDEYKGLILGDGEYKEHCKLKIIKHSLKSKIRILKAVEPNEVYKYISIADICLVLASNIPLYRLYTPNKLFEYLLLKKKVIVPKLVNIIQLTRNYLPYYKSGSVESLKNAIIEVKNISEKTYLNNIKKIMEKHDWEFSKLRLLKLYRRLM